MAKTRSIMDRRRFLFKSSAFLAGNLLGLSHYSKVLAADSSPIPPKIALIIDDIGFSRSRLMNFLEIDVPVTFSILPRLKQSQILAEEIHARGHEVMLHQPMEPLDPHVDPGPGAVYVGDDYDKILRVIEENISDLPFVTGINNHMGSRFTACREKIKGALIAIKKRHLFFIDSLTTPRSKAYNTAKSLNIASACRNVFLDNLPERTAILGQLYRLRELAVNNGYAIGIGHPYPETAGAINSFIKDSSGPKVSMVYISRLISG